MVRNSQKVQEGNVLVTNTSVMAFYVSQKSQNGNMTILALDGSGDTERVSVTFANSCMIFKDINE